ncbi:MAG: hypothetical protein WC748_09795 [Legionellales bacterium]|jgi:hypothetical protein
MCSKNPTSIERLYSQFSKIRSVVELTCAECGKIIPNSQPLAAVDEKIFCADCFANIKEVK